MVERTTTRSPTPKLRTIGPSCSTTPTASCPTMVPGSMPEKVPRTMCRSVPQMADAVMRTIASVGSWIVGSGTSSNRMSPTAWKTTAFMENLSNRWSRTLHGARLMRRDHRPRRPAPAHRPLRRQARPRAGAGDHRPAVPDLADTFTQQDVDHTKVFADVAEYTARIMNPAHVENVVGLACRTALARRGVAHVAIPVDVQEKAVAETKRSDRNVAHHASMVPAEVRRLPLA